MLQRIPLEAWNSRKLAVLSGSRPQPRMLIRPVSLQSRMNTTLLRSPELTSTWRGLRHSRVSRTPSSLISVHDCLAQLAAKPAPGPKTLTCLETHHIVFNKCGNTILHAAALSQRSVIIRHLLAVAPDLRNDCKRDDATALEALR